MSKLEDVINTVRSDLSSDYPSKSDFLAQCALDKIQTRSNMYNDQLDNFLKKLEGSEMYGRSLVRTASSLRSLSRLITISYSNIIKMISQHEKNIFNKKD